MTSDAPETQPALTAEEWTQALGWPHGVADYLIGHAEATGHGGDEPGDLHALAALCLHDHPAGFTWRDVGVRRAAAKVVARYARRDPQTLTGEDWDEASEVLRAADLELQEPTDD